MPRLGLRAGIARAALNNPHRLLDLFDGFDKKSHLYSLNKCGITKCAEDPNEIPFCRLAYP
jgi:hypothetical protein